MIRTWIVPLVVALVAIGILVEAAPAALAAQEETVETDPIRCWWRTSAPAVRVGEPFSVVLTCAVVETEGVTVVPNQAELAPNAVQLPPFDVLGGSQGADLRTSDRRFFQYEYRARLVSSDAFGKDVKLPEMRISYKVRTRIDGEAIEGRDLSYVLPEASIRVISLVPDAATDIRDSSRETFAAIDRRLSRATMFRTIGGILMAFAGLVAAVGAARLVGGSAGRQPAVRTPASDSAILRQAGREVTELQRARREGGWTPALTARLLTVLRILAAYALDMPAAAVAWSGGAGDGSLSVRGRGLRRSDVAVPGWVTPAFIEQELKRSPAGPRRGSVLEALKTSLERLTAAHYGREAAAGDEAIDQALATGSDAIRQLKIDNLWIVKRAHALREKAGWEARA